MRVQYLGREDPLEEGMAPLQYSCLENSITRGDMAGYNPESHEESGKTQAT